MPTADNLDAATPTDQTSYGCTSEADNNYVGLMTASVREKGPPSLKPLGRGLTKLPRVV